MKVSLGELLMLGVQFIDGDTFQKGRKLRRGQYFGELETLEVLRSGVHVNGKCVCMYDYVDELNDFRIKNIRVMWDGEVCVGIHEGRVEIGQCPESVLLRFECDGSPDYVEGDPAQSLEATHLQTSHVLKFTMGYDPTEELAYVLIAHIEIQSGQFYVSKRYKTLEDLNVNKADAVEMIKALLPGLAKYDVEKLLYIEIHFPGTSGVKPQPLWEFYE